MNKDVYAKIVSDIIDGLKNGVVAWQQPYKNNAPQSVNGNYYRGGNRLVLQYKKLIKNYSSNKWVTFNQAISLGGQIIKGEKSTPIAFFTFLENKDIEQDEQKTRVFMKYYNVFNLDQTTIKDEIKTEVAEVEPTNLNAVEIQNKFFKNESVTLQTGYTGVPHYNPAQDRISIPAIKDFLNESSFHATLFHEMIHATGSKERLNRIGVVSCNSYNKQQYSKEELVAEIGAGFLCSECGIYEEQKKNTQAYINGWVRFLTEKPEAIFGASSQSEKATEFILRD